MKKLIAVLLAGALLASMGGVAFATEVCDGDPPDVKDGRIDKDLTVNVTIDAAICLDTSKEVLELGTLNPCNKTHGEDSVVITVRSNKMFRKDVGPRELTGTEGRIAADRLSLIMDKGTANEVDITQSWIWDPTEGKYWSALAPHIPASGNHQETLTVDLDINWTDAPGTYSGPLEVSASQV